MTEQEIPLKGSHKVRACLFNLIVYTHKDCSTEYFMNLVKKVMKRFPCRIILIIGEKSKEGFLKTTTTCHEEESGISCDQIKIEVSGPNLSQVPFITLPYIKPDLPVFLLWGLDPTKESEILPHLKPLATRLIFDGEFTEDLQAFSKQMLEHFESNKVDFVDMTWAKTKSWRHALVQTFDTHERCTMLKTLKSLTITYNDLKTSDCPNPRYQAIYFQAWLASIFDWKIKSSLIKKESISFNYSSSKGDTHVKLLPKVIKDLSPGVLLKAEIDTGENLFVTMERKTTLHQVSVHLATKNACELPFTIPLPSLQAGTNFMKEIFYTPTSEHYCKMLQTLSQLEIT